MRPLLIYRVSVLRKLDRKEIYLFDLNF